MKPIVHVEEADCPRGGLHELVTTGTKAVTFCRKCRVSWAALDEELNPRTEKWEERPA